MKKTYIHEFYSRLKMAIPAPKGELHYVNPYTLLVAVVLSAQATDTGVNRATKLLFKKVQTPAKMLDLGEIKLKNYIKTIGLFNTKAKHIIKLSELLLYEYKGQVPNDQKALEALRLPPLPTASAATSAQRTPRCVRSSGSGATRRARVRRG